MRFVRGFFAVPAVILAIASCSPKMRVAPEVKAAQSEEAVQRGRYLVNLAGCVDCHSQRDFTKPGAPVVPGTEFGGAAFGYDDTMIFAGEPFPGFLQPPNISQHPTKGIGAWTDGEIVRAIREGVNRDGKALFPMMPYMNYRSMSDEDALAIVAYLRTTPPVDHDTQPRDLDFPLNIIVNFIPEPLEGPVAPQSANDSVSRGKHLLTLGGCHDCHSPAEKGELIAGEELSGGVYISAPKVPAIGSVISSNITAHPERGIGKVTAEQFISMMRSGKGKDGRDLNPIMPWVFLKDWTDEDLRDLYAYLMSVPASDKDTYELLAKYAKRD